MNILKVVIVCVVVVFSAASLFVTLLGNRRRSSLLPEVPIVASSAEVCVKAVERNSAANVATAAPDSSRVVAIICGKDSATADRYEARNDALRSIARRRNLPKNDIDALLVYLRKADNAMRPERVAALKNDVMNLLRNQELPSKGLSETLIAMFKSGKHPPAVLD